MKLCLDHWTAGKIGVQRLTRSAIEAYQLEKLKETINWAAANSPFYEKHYENREVGTIADFQKLPFTCPEDVRKNGNQMTCVSQGRISRIVTLDSSGTTGAPKRIYFTEEDQELTTDFFHHGMESISSPGDTVMILMPCRTPGSIGDLLQTATERMGASVVPYGLPERDFSDKQKILRIMEKEQVSFVVALPTHLAQLAESSRQYQIPIRAVLLSAEYVSLDHRMRIAQRWNCPIFEHYGMTEMGLGGAVSCYALDGYHVREADLYIEIIDPHTGEVLLDGQPGEIVFTTLTRKGMPFVRYRTGDRSMWITGQCQCGSKLKRLARVGDRKQRKGII